MLDIFTIIGASVVMYWVMKLVVWISGANKRRREAKIAKFYNEWYSDDDWFNEGDI